MKDLILYFFVYGCCISYEDYLERTFPPGYSTYVFRTDLAVGTPSCNDLLSPCHSNAHRSAGYPKSTIPACSYQVDRTTLSFYLLDSFFLSDRTPSQAFCLFLALYSLLHRSLTFCLSLDYPLSLPSNALLYG